MNEQYDGTQRIEVRSHIEPEDGLPLGEPVRMFVVCLLDEEEQVIDAYERSTSKALADEAAKVRASELAIITHERATERGESCPLAMPDCPSCTAASNQAMGARRSHRPSDLEAYGPNYVKDMEDAGRSHLIRR